MYIIPLVLCILSQDAILLFPSVIGLIRCNLGAVFPVDVIGFIGVVVLYEGFGFVIMCLAEVRDLGCGRVWRNLDSCARVEWDDERSGR